MTAGEGWSLVRLGELPTLGADTPPAWKPVRHVLGLPAFGVNVWLGDEVGGEVIEEHDELEDGGQEELYFVASGGATFTVDGERVYAPAGTFIALRDPALRRVAVASEPGTVVLAVGGFRDRGFTPSGWEQKATASL